MTDDTRPSSTGPEPLELQSAVTYSPQGIASRILSRGAGGNLTMFAFDAGQELSEHTSPFEAFVLVIEGSLILRIGGVPVTAAPGHLVRMPANVPHAVEAHEPAKMLLVMLRN